MIGAGFIGAEVAATCRGRGLDVTVLEALPQPMVRGLGPELGAVIAALHRDHGVDLRPGVAVEAIEGDERRVEARAPRRRHVVDADVVVVGVGVLPETEWLEGSGLTLDNGVVCDARCAPRRASSPPATSPAGRTRCSTARSMRLEHWTNATEQGVHARPAAARRRVAAFAPVPFVWSDQYDVKIQTVGVVGGRRRRRGRARHARRPAVRRAVRARRPAHRRARVQPARARHAVPAADRRPRARGTTRCSSRTR